MTANKSSSEKLDRSKDESKESQIFSGNTRDGERISEKSVDNSVSEISNVKLSHAPDSSPRSSPKKGEHVETLRARRAQYFTSPVSSEKRSEKYEEKGNI